MKPREIQARDTVCQTSGECLLRLGTLAKFMLRHGSPPSQVAGELGVGDKVCALSLAFRSAPDWFKFQALFEGWNLLVIRSHLRNLRSRQFARPDY